MKVSIKYSENLHFTASARHFDNIQLDEPESFHGTDIGPSPVEYYLIGIGGCLGSTFTYCLQKQKVEIDSLEVVVDGQLKHASPNMSLQLINIEVELLITVKDGQPSDKIEQCVKTFQDYCVVSNSITQGVPLDVKISQK
jgi:putative redox protein